MTITIKLHASLKKYADCNNDGVFTMDNMDGKKLTELIESLKINFIDIGFCAINKSIIPVYGIGSDVILKDNDYVQIFTAMKGG